MKKYLLAVLVLALGAGAALVYFKPQKMPVSKPVGKDAWFLQRYDAKTPLFLDANNTGSLLDSIKDPQQRDTVSLVLDQMAAPALGRSATPKSCAVVGNSDSIAGSHFGAEIDAHAFVLRVSNPNLQQHPADRGTRVTHHLLHMGTKHVNSYQSDTVTILTPMLFSYNAQGTLVQNNNYYSFAQNMLMAAAQIVPDMLPIKHRGKKYANFPENLAEMANSGLLVMHPAFSAYINAKWMNTQTHGINMEDFAIMLALHLCDSVDLYGYTPATKQPNFYEAVVKPLDERGIVRVH